MANQPWLDEVRKRLARQALPSAYIRRFMEELSDHLDDLKEENMEADATSRLGEPEQVANAAVAAYRQRSFFGRHPILTCPLAILVFAISPIISQCVLMWVGVLVLFTLGGNHAFDWYEHHWSLSLMTVLCAAFLSILYGELAVWLAVGKKWTLTSCAVLGAIAMFWEFAFGQHASTGIVMMPMQFATPMAVGWWFAKRKCGYRNAVMTFLVFAISPLASYMLLFTLLPLVIYYVPGLVCTWFDSAAVVACSYALIVLMYVVPAVVASSLVYWKLAKGLGSGKRWLFILCLVFATLGAMPFMPLLLFTLVPTGVASLFYCKLARRFGLGRRWMCVSCIVLATFAAMQSFSNYNPTEHDSYRIALTTCTVVAQFLVPLAIGWWFLRRNRDRDQLQLACD